MRREAPQRRRVRLPGPPGDPRLEATRGVDGWVSLDVSPWLAYDTESTVAEARSLHRKAGFPNLFIKVPGTHDGLPAIEELI